MIAEVVTLLHDHHAIAMVIPPAVVMAAILLDYDGLGAGGLSRDRQRNTDGSESSKGQNDLTH
jgi:hypothetical protein